MSIKLQCALASVRARCDKLEQLTDNLTRQVLSLEMLVSEYYSANLELAEKINALSSPPQAMKQNKPSQKPVAT